MRSNTSTAVWTNSANERAPEVSARSATTPTQAVDSSGGQGLAIAASPHQAHLLAAIDAEVNGRYLEAARAYDAALMLDSTSADVWNNLGVMLAKSGHVSQSVTAFENSIKLNATHAHSPSNLAMVQEQLRNAPPRRAAQRVVPQGDPAKQRFGIDWQVSTTSGWGIYGLNLVANTLRRHEFTPVVFHDPDVTGATPDQREVLKRLSEGSHHALSAQENRSDCQFPTLHALGNRLIGGPLVRQLRSTRRVGLVFLEDSRLDPDAVARGRMFDRIVAGSTWNEELLRAQGLEQTRLVFQGVDTSVFHPAPRTGRFAGRFVVFSGGKLEYRKGQDLVVAAFARFHLRHPDAMLMVAWHNHWPQTVAEIVTAGHVRDVPSMDSTGRLELVPWLARYAIPADVVIDLGLVPNCEMAAFVREADVAVFPNRAEGGTNLVAMETLASGVPCILSENTGHLDLTSDDHNIVLHRQGVCLPTGTYGGTDGWGECDVDEIVEALELAYTQRDECLRRASNAAAIMANASWHHQIDRLFAAIGDVLS